MGTQELREQLIKKIEQADEKTLNALQIYIDNRSNDTSEKIDDLDQLPESIKRKLKQSIEEADRGELIPHENVMREARVKYGFKKK